MHCDRRDELKRNAFLRYALNYDDKMSNSFQAIRRVNRASAIIKKALRPIGVLLSLYLRRNKKQLIALDRKRYDVFKVLVALPLVLNRCHIYFTGNHAEHITLDFGMASLCWVNVNYSGNQGDVTQKGEQIRF